MTDSLAISNSNNNNIPPVVEPEYKPLVYTSESKSSIKINMVVGPLFAITFFALSIAASADPGAFGSIAAQVTEGCAIAGTIVAVSSIAYLLLMATSAEKDKEREATIRQNIQETNETDAKHFREQRQIENDSVSRRSQRLNRQNPGQDLAARRQIVTRTEGERYHNLAANVNSGEGASFSLVADPAANNRYQIPYLGKYNPNDMAVPAPKMAVRLPPQQRSQLPPRVARAVQGDKNVELFFQVFDDRDMNVQASDRQKNVRNIFTQALYLPYDKENRTWVSMGVFEPVNIQSHPIGENPPTERTPRYTLPLISGPEEDLGELAVNAMGQRLKEVQIHSNGGRWSPNTACIVLEEGKTISSFYFISKTHEKTTISHIVICRPGSEQNNDATRFLAAADQPSVQAFLDNLNLNETEYRPLVAQIKKEFGS